MRYTWEKVDIGAIDTLGRQFEKVVRGCNQGSISTRHTYLATMLRFIKFIALEFNVQKIQNIQDKHLYVYGNKLKKEGKEETYIKKELSAIRFFHNQTNGTRFELMDSNSFNQKILELNAKKEKPDRSWTEIEIVNFLKIAEKLKRHELVLVVYAALILGLRIDEAVSLKTIRVVKALEENKLYLTNTKGGRPRTLYLSCEQRKLLEIIKENAEGEYAICPLIYMENHEIHKFKKSIQNFIYKHQKEIADPNKETMPTFHGLRHTFAQNLDRKLIAKGYTLKKSAIKVGNALGHGDNRPDITYAYLHR